MTICPNCGFRHEERFGGSLAGMPLPRAEKRVLIKLIKARGGWVTNEQMVEALYGDHADGGPENARSCVWSHTSKLNKKISAKGWKIGRERHVGYRLERLA